MERKGRSLHDAPVPQNVAERLDKGGVPPLTSRHHPSTSLRAFGQTLRARWRLAFSIVSGLVLVCLVYCLVAPRQYEATARVGLRVSPATTLNLDPADRPTSGSSLLGPLQLETLAGVFRSDQLAWRVILEEKLYQAPAFIAHFSERYPGFRPEAPSAEAESRLLEEFHARLHVNTIPRTLLLEIRFRSRNAALSAEVVNALVRGFEGQEADSRVLATTRATGWLQDQLKNFKSRAEADDRRLSDFQKRHNILISQQVLANGLPGQAQHLPALQAVDDLGRELVAASAERIQREAEFRAASQSDPELVLTSDPRMQADSGNLSTAALHQIHARRSVLEQEQAQLSLEHGPNFPRVVEVRQQLLDLDRQVQSEDAKLKERFRSALHTALDREQMVRKSLQERTEEGLAVNDAVTQFEAMRQEADASHVLVVRMQGKVEEAGLAAGVHSSDLWIVDAAHTPAKPVAPDLPLYLAVTLFVGLWLAVGAVLLMESLRPSAARGALGVLLAVLVAGIASHGQAPTPSTSGLPTGVAHIPTNTDTKSTPNPKDAPAVWPSTGAPGQGGLPPQAVSLSSSPMAAPIAPGDLLDITEFHTPEFHSSVRVSPAGTVTLPLVDEVKVEGLSESEAAHAIAAELIARGMLLHPQVFVLVTAYVGQDVSVLGEVGRPGVYPYAQHHRLLDLISAASGLGPGAGRLVNVYHRADPNTPHLVLLDRSGTDSTTDHNPELAPGDTVEVIRGGLIYVVGDVIRPGGFAVDGTQATTVLQALSLAWGPSQNAALSKALLIREQKDGRTVTSLNLKRMLHGQDPDLPVHERDILFVPDSTAKNLWNRTVESAIQSAAGVSIYAGMVYSQRF